MYKEIADHCAKVVNAIPGNSAVFFPSYQLLNDIRRYFETKTQRTVFSEQAGMSREEKNDFLERFKTFKQSGAVLLGVITGNFGEGVDLPGDLLRGVVVVGLPLQKPDLETKALIRSVESRVEDEFGTSDRPQAAWSLDVDRKRVLSAVDHSDVQLEVEHVTDGEMRGKRKLRPERSLQPKTPRLRDGHARGETFGRPEEICDTLRRSNLQGRSSRAVGCYAVRPVERAARVES